SDLTSLSCYSRLHVRSSLARPCADHPSPRACPPLPAAADPRAAGHGGGAVGARRGAGDAPAAAAMGGPDLADRDADEPWPLTEGGSRLSGGHARRRRLWRIGGVPDPARE